MSEESNGLRCVSHKLSWALFPVSPVQGCASGRLLRHKYSNGSCLVLFHSDQSTESTYKIWGRQYEAPGFYFNGCFKAPTLFCHIHENYPNVVTITRQYGSEVQCWHSMDLRETETWVVDVQIADPRCQVLWLRCKVSPTYSCLGTWFPDGSSVLGVVETLGCGA